MSPSFIPFNRAEPVGEELKYLKEVLESGHLSGDGGFTRRCTALLERALGGGKVLLTTSCTHALEMAGFLLELQAGDEVIVPSFTFVSSANAFILRGARPVFADIRSDTLNLDEEKLERLITSRTKALVVTHYAGVACEMDPILELAARRGIVVVEDNAHGLFGAYKGRPLGTMGALATLSFHETKNFTCGEGGALVVNDPRYAERAEIVREKGTNRSRFFRGQVDKYTWVDFGSSYLPSDILAAVLFAQLEAREQVQAQRRASWQYYFENLEQWARVHAVALPAVPAHCRQPFHLFYMLMPTNDHRDSLIAHLRAHGIASAFHYLPLHLSEMGRRLGGREGDCPVTEDATGRLIRLPFFNTLSVPELERVVAAVTSFPL